MVFKVTYKSGRGGRKSSLIVVSDNFEDVKKKFTSEFGKNLVSITWMNREE